MTKASKRKIIVDKVIEIVKIIAHYLVEELYKYSKCQYLIFSSVITYIYKKKIIFVQPFVNGISESLQ